jgi:5'-deoxynucleotidase YfbR-like HD superfamily hydrolase
MTAEQIVKASDEEIIKIAKQLRIAYQLKLTIRYGMSRDVSIHGESVAEHVFALLYLAQYFLPLEDPEQKLDKAKVYEILLFHDFGEIANGDIPYHIKTATDEAQEVEDAKATFKSLPEPIDVIGRQRWEEYEDNKTPEARFVYALDKIEPAFELLDPVSEKSLKKSHFTYEQHMGKKREATKGFPVMWKFIEVIGADMNKRKVFWEAE